MLENTEELLRIASEDLRRIFSGAIQLTHMLHDGVYADPGMIAAEEQLIGAGEVTGVLNRQLRGRHQIEKNPPIVIARRLLDIVAARGV